MEYQVRENKRYKEVEGYTIKEVVEAIHKDFGKIDIFIHSLANAPNGMHAMGVAMDSHCLKQF